MEELDLGGTGEEAEFAPPSLTTLWCPLNKALNPQLG